MCQDSVVLNGIVFTFKRNGHLYHKDLTHHLVVNWSYSCEYCHNRETYEIVVDFYYERCPEYPIP